MDEVTRFMARYVESFAGDPAITAEFYAEPMMYVGVHGVSVIGTKREAIAFVEGILKRLRVQDFSGSTVERSFVWVLQPSIALCAVEGIRWRSDGSELERIGATYVLTSHPDLKIRSMIATDQGRTLGGYMAIGNIIDGLAELCPREASCTMHRAPIAPTGETKMDAHRLFSDWLRTTFPGAPPVPTNRVMPTFLLPNQEGWLVSSEELKAQGPYVLAFFHGSWCPDCIERLKLFEAELDRILELGAEFVACSPETLDFPRRLKADYGFRFPMLSDVDCALSIDLGIAFLVPKEIQQDLTEMGIDLATRHGDSRCILPIPLTMVVNRTGEIVQNFVEEGRKVDLDGMAAVLSGLQQQGLLSTNL